VLLLEAAWRRFVPSVGLAYALDAVQSQSRTSSPFGSDEAGVSPEPTSNTRGSSLSNAWGGDAPHLNSAIERESEKADTLEWDESTEFDSITDGIGSLSVDPKGTGYMGPQSGNALLRYLSSIAAFFPVPDDDRGSQLETINSAESATSRELAASSTFTNSCIDWYFKFFHSAYPILHEGFFRAQFVGKDAGLNC
jgi:transcriptional regulatory protein GAL4